ncbi:Thiol-specific monooxygenase [Escovopsis weberi]|uniref:Thiol-specific monooxygenase n=1 Tax=Escovopsis weberi TaxID=150374 RepID=A0A0M8NA57_ESCWE|nr:Thiol-specific monooxygenase [Escovopsis weberi]
MSKSVCIVGAGPSGLAAAKSLLHNAPAGTFKVVLHSVQFSDLAWEPEAPQFPRAWMVGRYLKRYFDLFLKDRPDLELELGKTVAKVERADDERWTVHVGSNSASQARKFDYLLVASGYYGKPIVPACFRDDQASSVPVVHSSRYRDLKSLLANQPRKGGKILVVGGQFSGVEIAGTIASHLSSAIHSPDSSIVNVDAYSVHHVVSKPVWVFPLYTTPEPTFSAPPFLPIDFSIYNVSARKGKVGNPQGHVTGEAAAETHAKFEMLLGDQSDFSPLMRHNSEAKRRPPIVTMSDWYCEFVRSGFDASSNLSFLPKEILQKLGHSPEHNKLALTLAFHSSYHPAVPRLGFVGYNSNPYWGVMQLQARLLTKLWSGKASEVMTQALEADASVQRMLYLRGHPQAPQIPAGDYVDVMSELAAALSIDPGASSIIPPVPTLSANNRPLDMFTPSHCVSPEDDALSKQEAQKSLEQTRDLAVDALTTPRFVAYAVFRSLLGRWRLERKVTSRLPSHPSGTFVGTADFFLREQTSDGMQCDRDPDEDSGVNLEYLYVEEGEFKTDSGFGFRATRRYIWRYNAKRDVLSVWFAKTDDARRADYLFHEVEFNPKAAHNADAENGQTANVRVDRGGILGGEGWTAKAGHLCVNDYYDVKYEFVFKTVNLKKWGIEYTVNGPKKDYTIQGTYERA